MKLPEGIRRRQWLLVLTAILALGVGFAAWRQGGSLAAPPPPEKLVIGLFLANLVMPVIVAEDQGFLRDAGLDVTYTYLPTGKATMDALLLGEVDVAVSAETPIMQASFLRRDFRVIANFLFSDDDIKLLAHPAAGIRSAADLRGHRIAVATGTASDFFLHVLLTDNGLTSADVTRVPLAWTQMAEALVHRRADAIVAVEPFIRHAHDGLGNASLILRNSGRCTTTVSYVTRRDFPKQRKEALVRLLRGTGNAIDWMRSHRDAAIAVGARRLEIPVAELQAHWDDYRFALELQQGYLISLEQQALWAMSSGAAPAGAMPNYLDFIDFSAMESVKPSAISVIH
jgi:NitT/TauT family transport system substrate-binding protein